MIDRSTRRYLLLQSAFTLAMTVTFFPVMRAELQNPVSFPVAVVPLMLTFAGLALFFTLLIGGLESCLPRIRTTLILFNVALALLAWLKGSIIVWNYGLQLGVVPDWQVFRLQGAIDIALCIAIPGAFAIAHRYFFRKAATICSFLLLAQALHLIWLSPAFSERTFADLLGKETLEVAEKRDEIISTTNNLVVIVLDTFQTDAFAELLAKQPALADALPGFRYFTDTASAYPFTLFSIPSILTGENYFNEVPYAKYQFEAYDGPNSVMKNLMDAGYYVELDRWGLATPVPYRSMLASNLLRKFFPTSETAATMQLFALYAMAPQFLKEQIFGLVAKVELDTTGTLDNNVPFIRNILRLPTKLTQQPVAKIIHLKGPHLPLRRYEKAGFDYFSAARDAETKFSELGQSRENYVAVAEQSIRSVVAFLKRFQDAGVYDKSTVFVFGDHGAGLQGRPFYAPPAWNIQGNQHVVDIEMRAAALPLLIAKSAGSSGPLQTSKVPVSLLDLNCTIRKLLPAHAGDTCFSLFDSPATPPPSRPFYPIELTFDPQGYLPPIKAYEIKGPAWSDESWRALPVDYRPRGQTHQIPPYRIEDKIDFAKDGNASEYQAFGWGKPEHGFTWTIEKRAELTIPLSETPSGPLTLTASVAPFTVPRELSGQTVDVFANGEKLAIWMVSGPGNFKAAIPSRIAESGRIDLRFDLPNARSQYASGQLKDDNELGIQVKFITLHKTFYKIGDMIAFGRAGSATDFTSGEWGVPADSFTWTGQHAGLALPLLAQVDSPLMLEMELKPLQVPGKIDAQNVAVYADSEKITEWQVNSAGRYRAAIPARVGAGGRINLRFDLSDARSQAELGLGEDPTRLGVQVASARIYPAVFRIGETVAFGLGGSAEQYQTGGWNRPDTGFTWTYGDRANLTFPLEKTSPGPLTLQASFTPLVMAGKVESQTVDVFANNEKVAEWNATGFDRYKAIIPARLTASGIIELSFVLPDATSPARLGIGADTALYSLQMQSVTLANNPYTIGDIIAFGEQGNSKRYQSAGWGDPQAGFTWTVGNSSTLDLDLMKIPSAPLVIEASMIPFVVPGRLERQAVNVSVNGETIADWDVREPKTFTALIPTHLMQSGHIQLRFDLPDATSPAALGLSNDTINFGVQVLSVRLH